MRKIRVVTINSFEDGGLWIPLDDFEKLGYVENMEVLMEIQDAPFGLLGSEPVAFLVTPMVDFPNVMDATPKAHG